MFHALAFSLVLRFFFPKKNLKTRLKARGSHVPCGILVFGGCVAADRPQPDIKNNVDK
jgi:hypothetical protein